MTRSGRPTHKDAEQRMRDLLREGGLEQPDKVSYAFDPDEVILFWHDPKLAVVVELDEREDVEAGAPDPDVARYVLRSSGGAVDPRSPR